MREHKSHSVGVSGVSLPRVHIDPPISLLRVGDPSLTLGESVLKRGSPTI